MKKKNIIITILIASSLIISVLVFPLFNGTSGLNILQSFLSSDDNNNLFVSDESNERKPYDYWFAPESSFGIDTMKFVNWSYFKQLFLNHTDWMLEYKRYSYSEWTDGLDYLTIDRSWNESGYWKFNLILDVPVDIYSARFTFGVDLPALDYVERSGTEVWINYSANATEIYSVMFNWSDIASIPGLVITKGVKDNMFWFRFRRDNIPSGHYEFDPTFGYTTGANPSSTIEDVQRATWDVTGTTGGWVTKMYAYTYQTGLYAYVIKCGLYEYIDFYHAGELLGTTNEVTTSNGWNTLTFATPVYVEASTIYYLAVIGDNGGRDTLHVSKGTGRTGIYTSRVYSLGFLDPWFGEIEDTGARHCIYAYYIIPPTTPTGEYPIDGSSCIEVMPVLSVTVDHPDDEDIDAYWYSNYSGSWASFGSDLGIDTSGGAVEITETASGFSELNTTYWWSVNVTDSYSWSNSTFYLTTMDVNTSVDVITPYDISESPLNIIVSSLSSCDMDNVSLYYRNSTDNSSWGTGWKIFDNFSDIHTYVCDDSDAQAYEGMDADGGFNDDDGEFAAGDYTKISVDDSNSVSDQAETVGEYQYHRFNFTIPDGISDITQIDITWRGYGGEIDVFGAVQSFGHSLWVKDTGSWSEKDSGTQSSKETLTIQKTSGFSDWISGGYLECAVQSDYPGEGVFNDESFLRSYYVEVNITVLSDSDSVIPYSYLFDFPNGTGFYEFYSIAWYDGDNESQPVNADARCRYIISAVVDPTVWIRGDVRIRGDTHIGGG